jgi:endonuclease-3
MADAKSIAKLLLKRYPKPVIALNFSNPLELLIATILSAQCTDVRVNEVTRTLFRKYKKAEDYARLDLQEFEEEIRRTGFFRNKAKAIIACCGKIIEEFRGQVPERLDQLVSLPGVGRKTANVVLGGAFGRQAMAVDTHVLRVSQRLGLAHSSNPDKVEKELVEEFPEGKLTAINLALIQHGRETCRARNPKCSDCVLYNECEWLMKTD